MVSPQLLRGISGGTSANRSRQHPDFVLKIRGVSYCRGVVGRVFRRNPLSCLRMPLHVGSRLLVRLDGSHLVPPRSFMDSSPEERRRPEGSGFHNVSSGSDIGNLGSYASLQLLNEFGPTVVRSPVFIFTGFLLSGVGLNLLFRLESTNTSRIRRALQKPLW